VLINVAAKTIDGVGWVNDHTSFFKDRHNLENQSFLRIGWMYMDEHYVNLFRVLQENMMSIKSLLH
jgi:hypothetical protein